jgi:5'-nucleotidase
MLSRRLPADVDLLKLEVPSDATPDTAWRVTRLSRQRYWRSVPSGRRYLAEKRRLDYDVMVDQTTLEPDSDIHAVVVARVVSVTPLSLDLTSRVEFAVLEELLE